MKKVTAREKTSKVYLKITGAGLVLILFFIIPLVFFSYTSFPFFVPFSLRTWVDNSLASAPFLPKNNRQIFTRTFAMTPQLSNYAIEANLKLTSKNGSELAFFGLEGTIAKAGSFASSYLANFSFPNEKAESANFAEEENNFYTKINQTLILPGLVIPQEKKTWYQVDINEIGSEVGIKSRSDNEIISDVNKKIQENQEKIITIVNQEKGEKEEKVDTTICYKIEIPLEKNLIKDLISKELEINQPKVTIWVSKSNFFLKKLTLNGKIDLGNGNQGTLLTFTYLIKNFAASEPSLPKTTTKVTSPVDLWLKLNVPDNDTSSSALLNSTQYATSFTQNFATLERIVKVIFLLPKAF